MTTDRLSRLRQDYAATFLRYLSRRDEAALWSAYELGRSRLSAGVSLLDIVQVHHAVLVDGLCSAQSAAEVEELANDAATFLGEVLASFEMTQRGFMEAATKAKHRAPPPP